MITTVRVHSLTVTRSARLRGGADVTVKVKANMKFGKIFEVAEVSPLSVIRVPLRSSLTMRVVRKNSTRIQVRVFASGSGSPRVLISAIGTLKFVFDGTRLRPEETPAEVQPLSLLHVSDADHCSYFI